MLAAKEHPGKFSTPYVSAMNVLPFPTMVATTNTTEFQADNYGNAFENLGTRKYTIVAFCPVMTALYGTGGTNDFDSGTKLGGVVMTQTDDLDSASTLYPD